MSTPYHELKSICSVQDKRCTRCNKCVLQCAFLKEYGTPGDIAMAVQSLPPGQWPNAYECSLCGLCGAVCPEAINPEELFLGMRRVREGNGELDLKPYGAVLKFEGRGNSEQYSLLRVPTGGDTILFPGCGMSATRSKTVRRLFEALQKELPQLGVGLGCCLKPSHDLGRVTFFEEQFGRLLDKLINTGVKRVITTCPNCQKVFAMYGGDIKTVTAYEILEEIGYTPDKLSGGDVIVHDPCPQRYDRVSQDAVRSLAERASMKVIPSVDQRDMTRCCGEGGMVRSVRPEFAANWTRQRVEMAQGNRLITSCSGCVGFLNGQVRTEHILDVLFDSKPRVRRIGPLGNLARLNLKRWFARRLG